MMSICYVSSYMQPDSSVPVKTDQYPGIQPQVAVAALVCQLTRTHADVRVVQPHPDEYMLYVRGGKYRVALTSTEETQT